MMLSGMPEKGLCKRTMQRSKDRAGPGRWVVWSICAITCIAVSSCAAAVDVRHGVTTRDGSLRAARHATIVLSPAVEAGWAGWCVSVTGTELSGSCPDVRSHGPILAERWGRGVGGDVLDVAVTSSDVAAVSLSNGAVIPTRAESGLPSGLRLVVVEITDEGKVPLEAIISHGFTPLNSRREQIVRAYDQFGSLGYEVRSEGWNSPTAPPHGICSLTTAGVGEIRALRGGVIGEERSYPGLIGEAFVTCAATEYDLDDGKISLLGGVLVNASHPGTTPGPLPQMRTLGGPRGIYEAPAEKGEIVAKRIAGAWIFVASGPFTKASVGLAQRLTLLEHLRATVHL